MVHCSDLGTGMLYSFVLIFPGANIDDFQISGYSQGFSDKSITAEVQ